MIVKYIRKRETTAGGNLTADVTAALKRAMVAVYCRKGASRRLHGAVTV